MNEEMAEINVCFALATLFKDRPEDVLAMMSPELNQEVEANTFDEDRNDCSGERGKAVVKENKELLLQAIRNLSDHLTMGL